MMHTTHAPVIFDTQAFDRALAQVDNPIPVYRQAIKEAGERLKAYFEAKVPVATLVRARAKFIDQILSHAWHAHLGDGANRAIALIAVGGYGRGELHPASDIDILILLNDEPSAELQERLGAFLTFLWDIGLEIGDSVRTLSDCVGAAERDITVATNLIESRLISGDPTLFEALRQATGPEHIWPSDKFFEAKWKEQINRHQKFDDTGYKLEPNIKEGPGGLRDIQMIGWVTKRHFGAQNLHDLVKQQFLTEDEYQALMRGQEFLWTIRFALHTLTGRHEDRLLFDHQRALAKMLGFEDETDERDQQATDHWSRAADGHRLGVELFMKQYYRTVMELRSLNEMLLQHYQEALLHGDDCALPDPINRRFHSRRGFIEASSPEVFSHYPFALLEVFLLLQQHPELKGIRASTIRLIRKHCRLIDDSFRDDIRCRALFLEIFRHGHGLTSALRRMSRYGILAAYLPEFAKIVGQMQYDLFHIYTVDQHTLFVVRNLRRFSLAEYQHEFPLCSQVFHQIPKPELLYIAGLYHDIAKGRGGDHSLLGREDALQFCRRHDLSLYDSQLVAWLVEHHLLMSATAQHKDIGDPEVINQFASVVEDPNRLNYLYLLTVADMRATNPKLWNSWKDALLTSLYKQTKRALLRGLDNPVDKQEKIQETQALARQRLESEGLDPQRIARLWQQLEDDYFLRNRVDEIVWHTQAICRHRDESPLVLARNDEASGATQVFIHTPVKPYLFSTVTASLDRLGLNIVEARISSSRGGYTMDTYTILEHHGGLIDSPARLNEIQALLRDTLREDSLPAMRKKCGANRQVEHFSIPTEVSFSLDEANNRTIMEVQATDRPGLLSRIAYVLMDCEIALKNAKISTFGAQVEDVFFITDPQGQPITDQALLERIQNRIIAAIDHDQDPATASPGGGQS